MNIIKKYNNISSLVKASFWFMMCSVAQKGIQFITVPIFTRIMTTEQYGQFSIYSSWSGIIMIFATLNLAGGVFNNGMLNYQNDKKNYISSMQGLSTIVTLVVGIVYFIFSDFFNSVIGLPNGVIIVMLMECLFTPPLQFWMMEQKFTFKYRGIILLTLAIAVINPLIGMIAVWGSADKGIARILSVCIFNIILGCVFYIYNLKNSKKCFDWDYWKFALTFNLPLIPHYLSQNVLNTSDRVMIQKFVNEQSVAIYSVAYSIGLIMNVVLSSVNATFIPWTYQKLEKREYDEVWKVANTLLIGMAVLSLVPIILAPEVISVMGPAEYKDAMWIVPPISISSFFIFVYSLFNNIEFYLAETRYVMISSLCAALLNVLLNWMMLPVFGYKAAAYTTLMSYLLLVLLHYLFMKLSLKRHCLLNSIYDVKKIAMVTFVLIVTSIIFTALYDHIIARYICAGGLLFLLLLNGEKFIRVIMEIKKK